MDSILKISLLLDFYGNLLTKKQFEMLDLHYNNDCSLSEIADEYKITRQGVFDNIKRGRASLFELENKLGLVNRYIKNKERAKFVLSCLEKLNTCSLKSDDRKSLNKIKEEVKKLSE